mgnify:CR=1 FL=1
MMDEDALGVSAFTCLKAILPRNMATLASACPGKERPLIMHFVNSFHLTYENKPGLE